MFPRTASQGMPIAFEIVLSRMPWRLMLIQSTGEQTSL